MSKRAAAGPLAVLGLLVAATAAAGIEVRAATGEGGRYSMSPSGDGFVRLDRETGAMTYCSRKAESWSCEAMADGQEALHKEIERLEAENKALMADKKHLEEMLGLGEEGSTGGARPEGGSPPGGTFKVPSEEDVDKMFDYLEGMIRKFKERVQKLEEKSGPPQPL